jgi:hypothetical protein
MKKFNHWIALLAGGAIASIAIAKLPVPVLTDEQKAKAEETKAKAAEASKKAAADEMRYQDRVADRYFREMKTAGKTVAPPTWVAPPPVVSVAAAQPSSSESHGQKQTTAPKTQNTANPAAAKSSTNAKPTPAKS